MDEIKIIEGKSFCDDRGFVKFVNDFDIQKYKRFYAVSNHEKGFIRAWHGHKFESKAVYCIRGAAIVAMYKMGDLADANLTRFVLTADQPKIIEIPAGYANGFKTLTDDCQLLYFSDKTVEESSKDDIRIDADHFGHVWRIIYR